MDPVRMPRRNDTTVLRRRYTSHDAPRCRSPGKPCPLDLIEPSPRTQVCPGSAQRSTVQEGAAVSDTVLGLLALPSSRCPRVASVVVARAYLEDNGQNGFVGA